MRKQSGPEVFRITGARAGLTEDVRARQRRYVISMSIRTVSVILAVVLWNIEQPLAWAMLVLGAVLPYVAVVFANGGRENGSTQMPTITLPPPGRPALEATSVERSAERDAQPPQHPADDASHPSSTAGAFAAGSAQYGDDAPAAGSPQPGDGARPAADAHTDDGPARSARTGGASDAGTARARAFDDSERPAGGPEPVTDRSDAH